MKKLILFAAFSALVLGAQVATANAQAAAGAASTSAAKPYYTVDDSTIGDLLDNPATKAVIQKDIPGMADNPQIDMARGMTLRAIQHYSPDTLTDEVLAKVDADFAKIPAPAGK
jgi:para-nitrobenzyl esterase